MENQDEIKRPTRPSIPDGGEDDTPQKKMAANPLLLMVVAVVISLFGSIMWAENMASGLVEKSEIDALTASVAAAQSSLTASISGLPSAITTQINTVLGTITNQVSSVQSTVNTLNTQVSSATSKIDSAVSSASSANSKVDTLTSTVNGLTTKITTLQTQLTAVEARLKALETPSSSGGESSSVIQLDVKRLSESLITSLDKKSISSQIKLVLTNPTNADVSDVIVNLYCETETLPVTTSSTILLASSPAMSWIQSGWWNYEMEFRNGWGLTVKANSSKTVYLTLTVSDTSAIFTRPAYGYNVDITID